ncbi:hypothetical protein KY362_04940 [Candidatus Woesearchaeota archaeon]|nr:hypothetical protein [Candidatus Woesearchaeota archaeon]
MPDRNKTLETLQRERDYEDELVRKLDGEVIASLKSITDMTEEEKERVGAGLVTIMRESLSHRATFENLIKRVEESGKDNF